MSLLFTNTQKELHMVATQYKITKNIPLPPRRPGRTGGALSAAIHALNVGDCFDYPYRTARGVYPAAKSAGIKVAVRRTGPNCHRVWRVS